MILITNKENIRSSKLFLFSPLFSKRSPDLFLPPTPTPTLTFSLLSSQFTVLTQSQSAESRERKLRRTWPPWLSSVSLPTLTIAISLSPIASLLTLSTLLSLSPFPHLTTTTLSDQTLIHSPSPSPPEMAEPPESEAPAAVGEATEGLAATHRPHIPAIRGKP